MTRKKDTPIFCEAGVLCLLPCCKWVVSGPAESSAVQRNDGLANATGLESGGGLNTLGARRFLVKNKDMMFS